MAHLKFVPRLTTFQSYPRCFTESELWDPSSPTLRNDNGPRAKWHTIGAVKEPTNFRAVNASNIV